MAAVLPVVAAAAVIAETVAVQVVGQVVAAVLNSALAPELAGLQAESFKLDPAIQLSIADAVEAVIKGHLSYSEGRDEVVLSGLKEDRFRVLLENAGEPIPLQMATEAWRRGVIPKGSEDANAASLEKAIRDSRIKNLWIPTVEELQFMVAPVGTIIEGWLRAQITKEEALALAFKQGVDAETATLMFKAAGRPPSPQELFTLLNRGLIEETGRGGDNLTLEQGYLETDLKDKWYEKWKALREYRPPPRTITALSRAGAISDEQALKLYQEEGLTAEMAAIYVKTAHHEKHAGTKEQTKAEWLALYVDQAITEAELRKHLLTLGFSGEGADLEVQLANLKVEHALKQRAINRVGTLYVGRRISKQLALATLDGLKMPPGQRDRLLEVWSLERADVLQHLSPVELGHAVQNDWLTPDQALEVLAGRGYGPRDAWIVLNVHLKGALGKIAPTDNLPPP